MRSPVPRCFVTRQLPGEALKRLQTRHEVEVWPDRAPPTPEQLLEHAGDAQGLLSLLTDRLDARAMEGMPNLKVISNYAVGYDNVDLTAAAARGIKVGNTPDVLTDATADLTFTLLLAAARRLPEAFAAARDGEWLGWEPAGFLGAEVHGQTLGIVGFGRIGQAVAARAGGFAMRVIHTTSKSGPADCDWLLDESDFVSLHTPLTPTTRHLIDANALKRMKPTAILINTARGQLVDQPALIDALKSSQIAGAALDVTDPEPPTENDPLLSAPNLVLTPHIGSATRAARERMADLAVDNLLAGLEGRPLPHEVTKA
ncbi:MAG: 2-hydroxyacid dehydrogenase [Solirubrobacteraceae bacterium]